MSEPPVHLRLECCASLGIRVAEVVWTGEVGGMMELGYRGWVSLLAHLWSGLMVDLHVW